MFVCRSGTAVIVDTPAKINLFLEVLARREDGYHELETLMSAVALFDTLQVTPSSTLEIEVHCRWAAGWSARAAHGIPVGDLPPVRENLVYRAVDLLRQRAGISLGVQVEIIKRIPSAAGLGGASSDAAAALVATNKVWQLNWSLGRLAEVAAELGSDVPFFLATGELGPGAAVCRGRGERIEPTPGLTRLNYVIVRPPEGLATPLVFRHCRPAKSPVGVTAVLTAARQGNPCRVAHGMKNDLEQPAAGLSKWIDRLRGEFDRAGSIGNQMSGSGTSVFGLFHHARQARRSAARLRARRLGAVYCVATAAAPARTRRHSEIAT